LKVCVWTAATAAIVLSTSMMAQSTAPTVRILLPERTRLLQGQLVDLVLEVRNATGVTGLSVKAGDVDLTSKFSAPVKADLDCDGTSDWVLRADLQSFDTPGDVKLEVSLTAGGAAVSDSRTIQVREFNLAAGQRRNVILFIGDAMGTAYRDAARLVSRSIVDANGKNSFRDGYFDDLLEMDKMPVSGMSMTYGTDSIVPDSANTGTAWATGNKSFLNAVNSLGDGTDCKWRFNGQQNAATLQFINDNPRVENLWQYLKRQYNYRTGIVSTAAITDATPAVEGAYTGYRQARLEIARQYRENPMLQGRPAFDLILGAGADPFTAAGRTDKRDLIAEFQALGYRYVTTASELKAINFGQPTLGLFKGSAVPAPASNGIATASDVNMDVAYDKLKLQRPASEPTANLGTFTDQPMLDLMTQKAIEVLSSSFAAPPFILMVEGASIDKQSHPNQAAGTIWDTIEFDKAVGVARAWAAKRPTKDTLILVTADHDQSMSIIGVSNVPDTEYFNRTRSEKVAIKTTLGKNGSTVR
jgi:alkaline phosphatase